jgi:exonuclease V gamma subunit
VTIGPIGANSAERKAHAIDHLADLLDLRRVGMQEPLLMPCETGYVWQLALSKSRGAAIRAAVAKWETDRFSPEADDPAHNILFADIASTGALLDTGFEHLAERLWAPILSLSKEETL